jgi:TonB family protein
MRAHRGWPVVFVLALGNPTALAGQTPSDARKQEQVTCWPGEPEIQNRSTSKPRTPIHLPPELAKAIVRGSVILKLCVTDRGEVERVLTLKSSGNAAVDDHYTKELSKRTFTPIERDKRKLRSVVTVAITIDLR